MKGEKERRKKRKNKEDLFDPHSFFAGAECVTLWMSSRSQLPMMEMTRHIDPLLHL